MLSFDSSLTSFLAKKATRAFWALRLYYNDESAFTGISDRTRILGGNTYFGSAQWGSHNQTLNINDFTTSNGTLTVKIQNAPGKFAGGRFSDLFSTNNYSNRKWELYQGDDNADFHIDNLIAGGVISSDIEHDHNWATFRLIDYWGKYDIELPINKVTNDSYPNAPEKNLDRPLPIAYGDTSTNTVEDGFTAHLVKGHFPAIIVDKWNETNYNTQAKPDNEAMHTLNTSNLYIHNKQYMACNSANVTVTAATPILTFLGTEWTAYIPLEKHVTYDDTDYDNTYDRDVTTSYNLDATGAAKVTTGWYVKNSEPLGNIETAAPDSHTVKLWVLTDTKTGTAPVKGGPANGWYFQHRSGPTTYDLNWASDSQGVDVTGKYSATQLENWVFAEYVTGNDHYYLMEIDDAFNANWDQILPIIEVGYIIELTVGQTFEKEIRVEDKPFIVGNRQGRYRVTERYHMETIYGTDVGEYIYWSGKGRKYGAWVDADSRNNGYNSGDLIENPTYMIEEIARTELGLTSANIRYAYFDTTGNTTNGTLKDTFNENNTTDIKFAFSNYKFVGAKRLMNNICQQTGQYVWWSGITLAIKSRKRSYTAVVATIDFKDVKIVGFKKTPIDDVFNKIQVDYAFDYGANKTAKSRTVDDNASLEDATSQGTTVNGYGEALELTFKMPYTLDTTTADNYGEALLAWFKDQRQILKIESIRATYNYLEVGDIVNFSNWDSNLKIFGDTISTSDGYMVTQITKFPNKARIVLTEVAGNIA